MAEGLEFYRSVLLFMYSHAASRISLQTLSTAKDTFLNKYVNQIGDYKRIIELKKKNGEDLNAEAETRMLFLNESLRSTNDYLNKALAE
jgi:hypothetical protein